MFNLCCCHGQLALYPMTACRPLTSLAAKRAELQATILLPLEKRKVARGNILILTVQNFVKKAPLCLTQLIIVVNNEFTYAVRCYPPPQSHELHTPCWTQKTDETAISKKKVIWLGAGKDLKIRRMNFSQPLSSAFPVFLGCLCHLPKIYLSPYSL